MEPRARLEELKFPDIKAWWDHVTEIPEDNKIRVFRRGTSSGLKGIKPTGGHVAPSSEEGARLLWKKAQKKEKKKKISETINKIIPQRSPNSTIFEWSPWKVLSLEISFHHWNIILKIKNNAIKKRDGEK